MTSAKESNAFMDRKRKGKCYFVYKHTPPTEVQTYLKSNEYREMNYKDELLYRVANANLDRFIDVIGRDVFEKALQDYRQAKQKMEQACSDVVRICGPNGEFIPPKRRSSCYYNDSGCGYECVDKLFDNGKRGAWLDRS